MIYRLVDQLKRKILNIPGINQVGFGSIEDYSSKEVKYPYVNISINNYYVNDYTKQYSLTFYFMDRGKDAYTSYNKTQTFIQHFLSDPELYIENYTLNYFDLDFKDEISGIYTEVPIYGEMELSVKLDNTGCDKYILTEWGDYIKLSDDSGYITLSSTCISYMGIGYILDESGEYYIIMEDDETSIILE